jgi:hypothetical protein
LAERDSLKSSLSLASFALLRKPNPAAPKAQKIETTSRNLIISRSTFLCFAWTGGKTTSPNWVQGKTENRKRTTPNSKLCTTGIAKESHCPPAGTSPLR